MQHLAVYAAVWPGLSRPPAQTAPSLARVVSINKELAKLSPIVDAFLALRELEKVRELSARAPALLSNAARRR